MTKKKSKKTKVEKYQKVYLASTLLVGIALVLFLLTNMFTLKVIPNTTASFSFTQTQSDESVNLTLSLNPNRHNIAFVRVKLYFDTNSLQLAEEITLDNNALGRTHVVTSMDDANEEGVIEIAMAIDPSQYAPNSPFTLANLTFFGTPGVTANVTIIDEDTQIVDDKSNLVPFSPAYSQLTLN